MIIVNYHNVLAHRPNAFNMLVRKEWASAKQFERQVEALAERFNVVPLDDIVHAIRQGTSLPRACAITFDDGYFGAYKYAIPALERLGLHATFFVVTGHIRDDKAASRDCLDLVEALVHLTTRQELELGSLGGHSLTCDACKVDFLKKYKRLVNTETSAEREETVGAIREQLDVPKDAVAAFLEHEAFQIMGWSQIDDLRSRGFSVGSHTRTHASLAKTDADAIEEEVRGSYEDLSEHTGRDDLPFAYPYGKPEHMSAAAVAAVERAGYDCALTTISGANSPDTDLFQLHRVSYKSIKKFIVRGEEE